jgi:hypothetical protein
LKSGDKKEHHLEPLFFGIITEPWQIYVTGGVVILGSAVGLWRAVLKANRADERRTRRARAAIDVR